MALNLYIFGDQRILSDKYECSYGFYIMQVLQLCSLAICFMSNVLNIEVVLNFVVIVVVSQLA